LIRIVALAALLPGLHALLNPPEPVVALRDALFDRYQRWSPRPYEPAPVRVVDIDDQTLSRIGQWPWPRQRLATLVQRLGELGAAVVALDMVFPEPDRLSPSAIAGRWPELYQGAVPADLPNYDQQFAAALARWPVVGGMALVSEDGGDAPSVRSAFAEVGPDPRPALPAFHSAVVNIPALTVGFSGVGSFTVSLDRDATLRRLPLLQRVGQNLVPSLALEALRVAVWADTIAVRSDRDASGDVRVRELRVADAHVPVTANGELWLHFSADSGPRRVPAWRVLEADAADLRALGPVVRGQMVLVGASATALGDFVPTPLHPNEAAVLVHAQALEQMSLGWFLQRPPWAQWLELALLVSLGACAFWLLDGTGLRRGLAMVGLLTAGSVLGSWLAFEHWQLLLDPLLPLLFSVPVLSVVGVGRYLRSEQERAQIRRAFGQFLAPDLVRELTRDPSRLCLGGQSREMSFLFSDIAGFTHLVEGLPPERLVTLVNTYLDGVCRLVIDHGGTIDKIVGDAVHVFFNAPLLQPDHAQRAVACASALDAFGREFAAHQQTAGIAMGVTRIGVNTGTAVVGNFGGATRFDYTAHGDAVNTAARLESANKILGTTVCVAASTVAQVPDGVFRPAGRLQLRGKTLRVEAFEPVGDGTPTPLAEYLSAYSALESGRPEGVEQFANLHARYPGDPLVALFTTRVRRCETGVEIDIE
jgi:adenylate cyclase